MAFSAFDYLLARSTGTPKPASRPGQTTNVQPWPATGLRRPTTTPTKPNPASNIANASGSGTGVIATTAKVELLGAKSLIWLLLPLPTRGHRFHWY